MPEFYNDALDDPLLYERCESFGGGMDGYQRSTLLQPDQYQSSENMLITDNFDMRTRPGADVIGGSSGSTGFYCQGLFYFDIPGTEQLVMAANGVFYQYAGATFSAMNGFTLLNDSTMFSAAQGVDKILVTGGAGGALGIWNGSSWTSSTGIHDPPTGATCLLWAAGRMWAAGFPGTGGAGKEDDAICVSNLLSFGAGQWDLTDRSFRVGKGEGDPIIGLAAIPATVPGQEVIAVLKQDSVWIVRADPTVPPANYSAEVNSESITDGIGLVGKRAFCVIGNDLLFVSTDRSVRSLSRMQAASQQYQVSPPLSVPLQPIIDRINWNVPSVICAVHYKQFALFAVPVDGATQPNTVLVWNGRLQRWVGVWTGWRPSCFEVSRFSGVHRLIIGDSNADDTDFTVNQWKDLSDAADDDTYKDNGVGYVSKFDSRAFLFGEPLNPKDAYHCELRFGLSNAMVNASIVTDNLKAQTWSVDVQSVGPTLPIDLPFFLTNPVNRARRKGLRGLSPWVEAYIHLESDSTYNDGGWWDLRSISLTSFLNTLASLDNATA